MLGSCNKDVVQASPLNNKIQMDNEMIHLEFDLKNIMSL